MESGGTTARTVLSTFLPRSSTAWSCCLEQRWVVTQLAVSWGILSFEDWMVQSLAWKRRFHGVTRKRRIMCKDRGTA